jgi:hypothetical protein
VDKDLVFGKKNKIKELVIVVPVAIIFKKNLKTCWFYERTGEESAVSFMARYLNSFKSSENRDYISELVI